MKPLNAPVGFFGLITSCARSRALLKTLAGSFRPACARRLLSLLLVFALPAVVQAQFTFTTNNGAITITQYTGPGGAVVIPGMTNGYPVTAVGGAAFYDNTSVTSVIIPSSVTSIGGWAFYNCLFLISANMPNSITNIGDWAFLGCYRLLDFTMPSSVTSIGLRAFEACYSLTSLTIPDGVSSVGPETFDLCISLTNVTIGNGVSSIGYLAFNSCSSLTNVSIPKSVTNIADYAFSRCGSLSGVYFQGDSPSLGGPNVFSETYGATIYYLPGTTNWFTPFGGLRAVLWNPSIQTTNANFGVQTNQFGFTIIGTTNIPIAVVACTNPANPAWLTLQTCTLTNGSIYFSDPQWTNYPARFYRIRSL